MSKPVRAPQEGNIPKQVPANYVVGTSGDDQIDISAETADFTVDGRGGNDTIRGGAGSDSLYGAAVMT